VTSDGAVIHGRDVFTRIILPSLLSLSIFFKCKEPTYKVVGMSLSLYRFLIIILKLAKGYNTGICWTQIITAPAGERRLMIGVIHDCPNNYRVCRFQSPGLLLPSGIHFFSSYNQTVDKAIAALLGDPRAVAGVSETHWRTTKTLGPPQQMSLSCQPATWTGERLGEGP
jgi:hypothetical protein